jgi:hypothetical protein
MLTPMLTLIVWSLLIWIWMYATRIPAMQKAKIAPQDARFPGSLDKLPDHARQVADNYNHLMEQPTVFYAVALSLAVLGEGSGLNASLAWAYFASRVVHSLVQATFNKIEIRFSIFALSSLVLIALTINAARAVF